jgi:hypothetical protein
MNQNLLLHFEKALNEYSKGHSYKQLILAKETYFNITGLVHEEDDNYEARMNSFNDWFLFNFKKEDGEANRMMEFLNQHTQEDEIKESFDKVNFSLFEFIGESLFKKIIIKDILHNKKISLSLKGPIPGLLKQDLFIGRVISSGQENFLMLGISVLPKTVKRILSKEAKKIRKLNDLDIEEKFLLEIESLNNKWKRYGHLDPQKVFQFPKKDYSTESQKAV